MTRRSARCLAEPANRPRRPCRAARPPSRDTTRTEILEHLGHFGGRRRPALPPHGPPHPDSSGTRQSLHEGGRSGRNRHNQADVSHFLGGPRKSRHQPACLLRRGGGNQSRRSGGERVKVGQGLAGTERRSLTGVSVGFDFPGRTSGNRPGSDLTDLPGIPQGKSMVICDSELAIRLPGVSRGCAVCSRSTSRAFSSAQVFGAGVDRVPGPRGGSARVPSSSPGERHPSG